jgi:eukaryotic translation initiation factor 2C
LSDLVSYLTSTDAAALLNNKEEIIQALNIIMGNNPKLAPRIMSLGSNRHYNLDAAPNDRTDLGTGLFALRGFFLSVRASCARALINIQVKCTPFFSPCRLVDFMNNFIRENGPNLGRLQKFLEGVRVNTTHIVDRNRSGKQIQRLKTIFSFACQEDGRGRNSRPNPPRVPHKYATPQQVQFWLMQESRYVSVSDYFRSTYNITLNTSLPVLNIGNRENPNYLPADVCEILPGEPFRVSFSVVY